MPPVIYGGLLTIGMVRSKLDEHKLARRAAAGAAGGREGRARARSRSSWSTSPTRSPTSRGVAAHHRARLGADDRRLQVRPDPGRRAPGRRLAAGRARPGRAAAALRRLDQRRPARGRPVGVERRPGAAAAVLAVQGADHRHLLRLQHPPRPAGDRRRRRSSTARSPWSAARCARTSTSPPTSGMAKAPDGHLHPAAGDRGLPRREGRRRSPPAARASRSRRCGGWPTTTTATCSCTPATRSSSRRRRCPATSAR